MIKGGYIADVTIAFASIDPCFSCTDRVTVTDLNSGDSQQIGWADLLELSRHGRTAGLPVSQ